jgi:hypothetical protein
MSVFPSPEVSSSWREQLNVHPKRPDIDLDLLEHVHSSPNYNKFAYPFRRDEAHVKEETRLKKQRFKTAKSRCAYIHILFGYSFLIV